VQPSYATRHYTWETLHYKLHTCEPGVANVEGCSFTLSGRINPRWGRCPDLEAVAANGYTSTFYSHTVTGMGLSSGRGSLYFPSSFTANSLYPTLLACWYVHIGDEPHALLTASTLIPAPRGVTE
jgi:hypothetical protein